MISSRSYQPEAVFGNRDQYEAVFLANVHELIRRGYERLARGEYAESDETAITGDLVAAINEVLDMPEGSWMRFYSVHDDPPVNHRKQAGRERRQGRRRKRVDIRFDSAESSPRGRFHFECKRLGRANGRSRYVGSEGLGCFLRGDYSEQSDRAGMLGYVQNKDEKQWAKQIAEAMASKKECAVSSNGSWKPVEIVKGLSYTFRSVHNREGERPPIEIFHTFLRFY